jgi:hypothetical protein
MHRVIRRDEMLKRLLAVILVGSLALMFLTGFGFGKKSEEETADTGFMEFIENDPEPYKDSGNADLDKIGDSLYSVAAGTHAQLKDLVAKNDNNETYVAYQNDVDACVGEEKTDEKYQECVDSVKSGLSEEDDAKLEEFTGAQSGLVEDLAVKYVGLAAVAVSVKDMAGKGKSAFSGNMMAKAKQAKALNGIKNQLDTLLAAQSYVNKQKAIMSAFESHEGR